MTNEFIMSHVDHTLLKAFASMEDINQLCKEALEYNTASVCVPACYVRKIKEEYHDQINICTVIGFPMGYSTTTSKIAEAQEAVKDGADEIDMVINITDVKNKDFDKVRKEVTLIRKATDGKILKVIIETCYLTEEEKITLCKIVTEAKADFIKTSTGFGTAGATLDDILLFKKHIGPEVRIKAAGGVRQTEDLESFLSSGCDRIGTSSAVQILQNRLPDSY